MIDGRCLCGALRYALDPPFGMMLHCHCSICRKHHGAAFATWVSAPFAAFRWIAGENDVRRFQSSEHGARGYCGHCSSVAPQLLPDLGLAIAPAGNLDGELGIRPQSQIFVGSKASWYTIADDLPQHAAYPPELGGGEGVVRPARTHGDGVIGGSCVCGEVAYEMDPGALLRMINCHCSRCRRGRSAAHTTNLFVSLDGFRWLGGEMHVKHYKVPEAVRFAIAFCTRCGGKVPRVSPEAGWAVVPAGALDTDPGMRPQAHIFVGSKASWFDIRDTLPQFAEMPT